MDKIINYLESKLPYEIVENIIKLTYQPQPSDLLVDITSFHESKSIIINHYLSNEKKIESNNVKEYYLFILSWICNDFILYLNNDLPTMLGYSSKLCNKLFLLNYVKTHSEIDLFLYTLMKNPEKAMNVILGLLTPKQRNKFINKINTF